MDTKKEEDLKLLDEDVGDYLNSKDKKTPCVEKRLQCRATLSSCTHDPSAPEGVPPELEPEPKPE